MARKHHKQSPHEAELSELVEIIKHAYAGKKDSIEREDIKKRFDLLQLESVYRLFVKKGNEKVFFKVLGVTAKQWGKIATLIKHYKSLLKPTQQEERNYEIIFNYFIGSLGGFADFKIAQLSNVEHSYITIKFINPPLECLKGDLLFFRARGDAATQEIQRFINIIESMPQQYLRKVAFVLAFSNIKELIQLSKESRYKFVVISSRDLKNIVLAGSSQIEFNKFTTSQLDLLDIQPYRTHSSTPSIMFFGRKRVMDWMLNDPSISFAIYGGRQLGKTSLLRKIQEILDEDNGQKTIFVTCEGIKDNISLGIEILKQVNVNISGIETIGDFEQSFRDYLRTQKSYHTIFIDEVDDLVDLDRKCADKIFVALRNVHNDFLEKCRFFFAGFKKLYSEFYRLYAPFRNFAEPYELKSLPKKDAHKLIREPLCDRLGIEFRSQKKILEKIYQYSAGHPCFIQHYCKCLIMRIAEEERRIITEEDIEDVYRSEAYRNLVTGNYSDNFREGEREGDVIPKLLVCLMIFEELETCSEDELMKSLRESSVEIEPFRLRSELRKLTMTSVLERHGNLYRFTNSVYPRILRESENIADVLIQLIERCQSLLEQQKHRKTQRREPGEQFVLREKYLEQIVADSERSYTLIGGNGFGKTAATETLKQLYRDDLSAKVVFIAGNKVDKVADLLTTIVEKLDLKSEDMEENLNIIKEFIAEENQSGRRMIILIDDIEMVAQRDRKELRDVLEKLENLSMEFQEGFRVILAGGFLLYSIVSAEPFSKTMEIIRLKPLDERDSQTLLLRILNKKWHLHLEDETLTELVTEYTGGNPCLMEKFSEMLAQEITGDYTEEEISLKEKDFLVSEEDIELVADDPDYKQYLLKVYQKGWEENQKQLATAIAKFNRARFTVTALTKICDMSKTEIIESLEVLNLLGFIKRTGKSFRLTNSYYQECFAWNKQIL